MVREYLPGALVIPRFSSRAPSAKWEAARLMEAKASRFVPELPATGASAGNRAAAVPLPPCLHGGLVFLAEVRLNLGIFGSRYSEQVCKIRL